MVNREQIGRQTIKLACNDFTIVTATGWVAQSDGTIFLDENLTAKVAIIPVNQLEVGDGIVSFRLLGALGATAANATALSVSLRKVTKGAGAVVDALVASASAISVTADTALDSTTTLTTVENVSSAYSYYVLVSGTTANNAACDAALTEAEIVVTRKV